MIIDSFKEEIEETIVVRVRTNDNEPSGILLNQLLVDLADSLREVPVDRLTSLVQSLLDLFTRRL